jgi:hypothetical protein
MDFLMLLPHRTRVVIECDGVQHYADDQVLPSKRRYANPRRYGEMAAEDRELRLAGYEVYRFGGVDVLYSPDTPRRLDDFCTGRAGVIAGTRSRALLRPARRG